MDKILLGEQIFWDAEKSLDEIVLFKIVYLPYYSSSS